jgi:integrase
MDNSTVNSYITRKAISSKATALHYTRRLNVFANFVSQKYDLTLDELVKTLTTHSHGPKIDVYELFSEYVSYIQEQKDVSPLTFKILMSCARNYLETFDVEISQRKFQFKVSMPRVKESKKEPLTKEDIQIILNACSNIKLKTYVLFLAATGCRASEALSIRLCDIHFENNPPDVFIRGEFTKTGVDRTIFLTSEMAQQLKSWIEYNHRTRVIGHYNRTQRKTYHEKRTPKVNEENFVFSTKYNVNSTINGLYVNMTLMFERTLDRLGGKYGAFENAQKRRRKITFHSFRRAVKGVISNLGFSEYSDYFIGHKVSTYYRITDKQNIELFRKCEPYISYLNYGALESRSNDMQTRLEAMEQENQILRQKDSLNADAIASLSDRMQELMAEVQGLKKQRS